MTGLLLSVVVFGLTQGAKWVPVTHIAPRADVHVLLESGATYRGRFVTADDQSITIAVGRNPIHVQQDAIRRVSVNRGTHHRRRNAVIGLLAGMVLGAAVYQARCSPRSYCAEGTPAGALPGMAAGAIVGAALPSGDWQVVYRR